MKNLYFCVLFMLLATHSLVSEEKKLFVLKTDSKVLYENSKFNVYLFVNAKNKEDLPKIRNEGFSVSYIVPEHGENKDLVFGNVVMDKLWVNVSGEEYKMLIGSPTIKGTGKSGVSVKFTYSHKGVDNLKFEDTIYFELK